MQKRQLGNTWLNITRIGLGTWAIGGGDWKFGWGPQDEKDSIAAIHRALELGINWIDTAPAYGPQCYPHLLFIASAPRRSRCNLLNPRQRVIQPGSPSRLRPR